MASLPLWPSNHEVLQAVRHQACCARASTGGILWHALRRLVNAAQRIVLDDGPDPCRILVEVLH
jgi:hypothetical protein